MAESVRGQAGREGGSREPGLGGSIARFFGVLAGVSGLLLAAVGLVGEDISPEAMGIVLGVVSYALGTRRLGAATVVVSTVLLIVVLAIVNGDLPGIVG